VDAASVLYGFRDRTTSEITACGATGFTSGWALLAGSPTQQHRPGHQAVQNGAGGALAEPEEITVETASSTGGGKVSFTEMAAASTVASGGAEGPAGAQKGHRQSASGTVGTHWTDAPVRSSAGSTWTLTFLCTSCM